METNTRKRSLANFEQRKAGQRALVLSESFIDEIAEADDVALSAMREKRARIDIDRVQDEYKAMKGGVKPFTKKALCELCVPFRDRYGLTDHDAISIASQRMALKEAVALCRRSMTEGSAEHE